MAKIKFRRDTAANWLDANPTLAQGEPGFEHDTGLLKIGDGTTAWSSLDYLAGATTDDTNVWIQTFETQDGAPDDIPILANSVEYDSEGNVIALFVHSAAGGSYYSVGKFTSTGVKIWTARFADSFDTDGWGLAVDNDSNSIYVAGQSEAEGGQNNATLTKIDGSDGSIVWSKVYDFGYESDSPVVDVASDGNPVMVGYASNDADEYVTTTKISGVDGSIIWTRSLDGQGDEKAYGMAVGPTGEVVSIGWMDQLTTVLEPYPVTPQTGSGVNVLVINRSDLSNDTFTDSWQVAGTGITGTIGVNAINIYTDLTSTVREGSGVVFEIINEGDGTYSPLGIQSNDTNYLPGHKIKILGTDLGGATPENDCIITVDSVNEVGIFEWSVTGTAAGTEIANYNGVTGTNYQTGSGLEFNFFGDSGSTYTEHPTEITAVGSNYVDGDVVVIPGTQLGGTSPANDLTATVSTADGAVTQFNTFSGTQQTTTYRVRTEDAGIDFSGTGTWTLNDVSTDDDDRMLVVKYNSTGTIAWQKAILFDTGFDCYGADADIDSDGNIYVTGNYQYDDNGGTTSALSILKLDSTGAKQWSRRVVGDCDTFSTSVVVGPDDKLYLSGVTGNNNNSDYTWVAAKYGFDGAVEWQRLIDNTTTWTFGGFFFFESGSGSNIAVKQDYVVLGGGFGFLPSDPSYAAVVQVSASGDIFSVGDWDFKAATFSGLLNDTASDITVVNAGKTDSDNSSNITTTTAELDTEVADFLIGTLYRASGADERLVNGENELVLESNGTVTLPSGGTISEGVVTSNPTIQLTPASPDVNSQKLVIKGGGSYSNTENGIYLSTTDITYTVFDTVEFYVYDPTRANETLYWWIVPEGSGISVTMSGTVALDGIGDGNFTFTLDSDAYEFRVRVSPEQDNYDPDNIGVESVLINGDAPAYGDYHLHLTTGDLEETSIFLGTDDHNVRTTTDRKIQITTPNDVNNVWEFGADGVLTFPSGNLSIGNALGSDSIVGNTDASVGVLAQGQYGTIGLQWIDNLSNIGSTSTQTQVAGVVVNNPLASTTGTVQIVTGFVSTATTATSVEHTWTFGTDGGLTFPDGQSIIRSLNVTDGIPGLTLFAPERIYLGIASSSTSWSWDFRNYGQNDYSTDKKPAVMLPGGSVIEEDLTNQELNNGMAGPLSISSQDKLTLRTNNLDDSLTPEATYDWVFGNDGDLTLPAGGNIVDSTGVNQTAQRVEGTWTVTTGTNTYNFTVPMDGTYVMWVKGNIPNGIITWNATVSVSNTNVPAIGTQYAWNYTGGGSPILLSAIPDQIKGTAGTISTDATYAGTTSNRFDFTIANTSGESQTVYYGYTKI